MSELPVIQKTYDFIQWYVPILNRLPRNHKFTLGDRTITKLGTRGLIMYPSFGYSFEKLIVWLVFYFCASPLYDLLEGLIEARYAREKLHKLEQLNSKLDILRYQTRMLLDFELISFDRYKYASQQINNVGIELGGWIKQQKRVRV